MRVPPAIVLVAIAAGVGVAGSGAAETAATAPALRAPLAPPLAAPLYPPDTRLTRVPTPAGVPRPGYLKPIVDPSFGTTITRIADERAFNQVGYGQIRHAYSKNQPWNADGSLLMLDVRSPAPLLDGRTLRRIGRVHQPSEAIWLNTDPDHLVGVAGNRLIEWDARADRRSAVLREFSGYRKVDLGAGEGNLSDDDRYAALFAIRAGGGVDILVYDLVEDRVVGRHAFRHSSVGDGGATFNNVAMSQSGKRVIIEFNRQGDGARSGIASFDRRLGDRVHLSTQGGTHFDACVDATGAETIVVGSDDSSTLVSVGLTDGKPTRLLPKGLLTSVHISCRNVNRPGWAYISEYADPQAPKLANHDEVFALKLDGSGTVERFAHEFHSGRAMYEREPQAVPSRDGSRVLWASDWQLPRGPVYAYVAEQR